MEKTKDGKIEYFMIKPKAKGLHNLQPREIVGVMVQDKWVQSNFFKRERIYYKESFLLWKMISESGKIATGCLTPAKEWRVLGGVNCMTDRGDLNSRMAISRQQSCCPLKRCRNHHCFGPPFLSLGGLLSIGATLSSFYLFVELGLLLCHFPAFIW